MPSTKHGLGHAEDYEGKDGGACIHAAVDAAETAAGPNVVMVGPIGPDANSRWEVSKAIELPSHATLLLQSAYLILADNADCDLIQNRDFIEGNTDIHVIGRGGARLDLNPGKQPQPTDHRDVELWFEEHSIELSPPSKEVIGDMSMAEFAAQRPTVPYLIVGIRFYNVENLSLRGFTIGPTVTFPIHVERVQQVRISDCTVVQDGREPWTEFIHIYGPAERIVIKNIVGSCSDDFCALTTSEPVTVLHELSGGKLPVEIRRANAGPIHGVVISNVVIRNRWSTGLLRILPIRGYPIDGVHVSNVQILETPGHSGAHGVLKFGATDSGNHAAEFCLPEDMANITVENVYVKDWVGPYITVLEPVKNLTLRGLRGNHTGPFFHNYGQAIDGLTLEDCRVTLTGGGADEPFVGPMMQFCMEEWGLDFSSSTGTPAAIHLNKGPLKDVDIRGVVMISDLQPEYSRRAAGARCRSLLLSCVQADHRRIRDRRPNRRGNTGRGFEISGRYHAQRDNTLDHPRCSPSTGRRQARLIAKGSYTER